MSSVEVECICVHPTAHRDTVTFRDTLDFRGAMACKQAVRVMYAQDPDASEGDMLAVLTEHYIVHGITAWTLRGDDGKPLAVTPTAIRQRVLNAHPLVVAAIADEADATYTDGVLLPLLGVASSSSPPTPTTESTSATSGSEPTTPTPLKPSSTTTTRTGGTGKTSRSPAGDSSSSQSSMSAA